MTALSFKVGGADPNPGQSLTYSLINNPPAGASIDAVTGSLKWTADESQGPGDYILTVQVTDNGVPPLSASVDIHVHVNEVNTPPGIQSIGTQVGASDVPLHFFVVAIDSDIPAQQIAFSLPPGSPLGAAINPSTGEFSWTPTSEQGGDYDMIVIVKDDGAPPLSQAFHIPVKIQGPAVIPSPVILATRAPDGTLTLSWAAVNGVRYHVEFTETLGTLSWNPLGDAIGDQGVAGLGGIELNGVNERYYRVVVVQ